MADNITYKDANAIGRTIRATEQATVYTPHNIVATLEDGVPVPVSHDAPMHVTLPSPATDSFGRFRTSHPAFRFDSQLTYQIDADQWDTSVSGGSITHDATNRMATLTANASGTNSAVLQSHYFSPYTPGRSQLAFVTFKFGATPGTGAVRRAGYFDGTNGVYLEQSASAVSLVMKSATTAGTTTALKADWNIDKLDGNGPSGLTLDLTKTHILVVSLQALYVGRVIVGFDIDGVITPVHQFAHANNEEYPYIQYASLPIRYEVSTTSAAVSMDAVCASVISEGGQPLEEMSGRTFTASNGVTAINVTTRRPILSIRAKAQLNSINNVALIIPTEIGALASTNSAFIEVVRNGTLTGASFASVDAASVAEVDVAASAISGGRVVASFSIPAAASTRSADTRGILGRLVLAYSHLLSTADSLSVVATSYSGTSNVSANIGWKEIR